MGRFLGHNASGSIGIHLNFMKFHLKSTTTIPQSRGAVELPSCCVRVEARRQWRPAWTVRDREREKAGSEKGICLLKLLVKSQFLPGPKKRKLLKKKTFPICRI